MDILLGLIAVLIFGLTCFGIGYTPGKDTNIICMSHNQSGTFSMSIFSLISGISLDHFLNYNNKEKNCHPSCNWTGV